MIIYYKPEDRPELTRSDKILLGKLDRLLEKARERFCFVTDGAGSVQVFYREDEDLPFNDGQNSDLAVAGMCVEIQGVSQ